MKKFLSTLFVLLVTCAFVSNVAAQRQKTTSTTANDKFEESTFSAFKLRNIGPAFMSGRIADIAIHPDNENIWYVAVGSGGVWKTMNSGTTWESIFDGQGSYSIGCVTIDPNNSHTIWVGTGEDVGGRHVGYGDGIYKSDDGGKTWENMGLKNSEHISKIIVHPTNPNIVWVASQGPLWSKGGERGVFKTTDGGKTWKKLLGDEEFTGATDLLIDPRNPDRLYAATWQHHRTVATYMGGGPKTAIYRTDNGGNNWTKLTTGLPKGNMGKIGLAISPQQPDVIYAAIELDRREGGLFRSENRGASWTKMSDAVSGGTGPHYYQELYASPHAFDRLYLCDVRIQVSDDGGKTFRRLKEEHKHSDNHSIAFRDDDPNYLLIGTDGGIYETFDLAENWRFINNLPITQFYKVAVDDKEPFYYVYGGTQDNNTQGGPSRTDNLSGIRNGDWEVVLYADGHQPATEPGNPDIMYAEWQQGNLVRVDRTTGEIVYIQPQPEKGEPAERFNWDAPILVSPHNPTTIYHASQRVWKSENRGDSWAAISGDLTRNQERITLPIMGKQQSWDMPWDMYAMSTYNTITSLSESPVQAGVMYAGTDDGLIQVTEDGGANWRKIEVGSIPGVPSTAFVNDIKADMHDANTVYVALDNHKYGDYKPYLVKSTDRGRTWSSIASNIPDRTLVWRLVQDHVKPELMFVATELGIYFTINGGKEWIKITGDAPTISFRDLAIQKRENDLIGASFGRGFFVLDDYSPLRDVNESTLQQEAAMFPIRKAWWYIPRGVLGFSEKGSSGANLYTAPNPPFGAVFTFYLKDDIKTNKQLRQKKEKELQKSDANIPFPGWEALNNELQEQKPTLWLTVKDLEGNVIRKLKAPAKSGFQRIAWDLRYPSPQAINIDHLNSRRQSTGMMVAPGEYTVNLSKEVNGEITELTQPVQFSVERLYEGALKGSSPEETVAFWKEIGDVQQAVSALSITIDNAEKQIKAFEIALKRSEAEPGNLNKEIYEARMELFAIQEVLYGNQAKNQVGENNPKTINGRLSVAITGTQNSTYGPTPMHRRNLEIAREEFSAVKVKLEKLVNTTLPEIQDKLEAQGAPWIEGMPIPQK